MDLDKIIEDYWGQEIPKSLDRGYEKITVSINDIEFLMKEAIRQSLELASHKAKVKWDDHENEFDVIHDDDRKIVVSKKSIMSIMDEL